MDLININNFSFTGPFWRTRFRRNGGGHHAHRSDVEVWRENKNAFNFVLILYCAIIAPFIMIPDGMGLSSRLMDVLLEKKKNFGFKRTFGTVIYQNI